MPCADQVTVACYAIRMYVYAVLPHVVVWAVLPVEVCV